MSKIIIIIPILLLLACSSKEEEKQQPPVWTKKQSVKLGEELAIEEDLNIRIFVESKPEWKFNTTGSGLRYYIYDSINEEALRPEEGDLVCVDLTITQLDGTACYKTREDECVEIIIDKSEAESGLQEGLKLMKENESAKLIVPSHLAHGLIGDQDKIPPLTTLLIDVKIVEVNK